MTGGIPPDHYAADAGNMNQSYGGQNAPTDQSQAYEQFNPNATLPRKKRDRHAYHTLSAEKTSTLAEPQGQPGFHGDQLAPKASPTYLPGQQSRQPSFSAQQEQQNGRPFEDQSASVPQGKVNADQIPSVPRLRDAAAQFYMEHVYPTMEQHLPPPSGIPYVAYDQGNASPKFVRLTHNNIPLSADHLASTGLPLGMILQPLAAQQDGDQPVPILDFGDAGPPRCRRCRSYINPFMTFAAGGNKFICNLCTFPNEVVPEYFSALDMAGVRVDRLERPELTLGTVEFTVPKEYWAKEPQPLHWLFMLDVSAESLTRGFLLGMCKAIKYALYETPLGKNDPQPENEAELQNPRSCPKIGIATFDKEVHFYDLKNGREKPHMVVMSELEDPFVPISEGLFVDPIESREPIEMLLSRLPSMFTKVKHPELALLPAIKAGNAALGKMGGKLVCAVASMPAYGPGKLKTREGGNVPSDPDSTKGLYVPEDPEWKKTATDMTQDGIGVDFYMAAPSGGYMDIATIGHLAAATGGENYFFPNFHSPRDHLKLAKEVKHNLARETGYQSLMKVRCSNGLQIAGYHGNFMQHTFAGDLEFSVIDSDKALAITFSYDGKLDAKLDAHFQSALLYTTANGERRVRCSNIVASVCEGPIEGMKNVDQDAVVAVLAKEAASRMTEKSLKEVRNAITERNIDILSAYRRNFSGSHPPGQLVLPENLKELSVFLLGLIKSRPFKGGREPTDRRAQEMRAVKGMGIMEMSLYLYPRLYPLHSLTDDEGFANELGHLRMPRAVRASFSRIEEGGAYLVDNGQICLLWLHAQVSPNLLEDLFGENVRDLKDVNAFQNDLPVLDTRLNAQTRNIMQYLETSRGSKGMAIQIARQGYDGSEYEFARLLYEDRNNEAQGYVDWLVHLHRTVQLEISGQRKKPSNEESALGAFAGLRTPYWG